ncbi:MAG: hypothetical protein AAF434_02475 [Pseudomonadota bacterium]
MANPNLTLITEQLCAQYGDAGASAARSLEKWLDGEEPNSFPEALEAHLDPKNLALLFDAFWQDLPFGTGGRRGRSGYGPNRINPTTVMKTIQGHCNYLKQDGASDLSVVIANDVRVFNDVAAVYGFLPENPLLGLTSRDYTKLACEIYAGNGITAYTLSPEDDSAVMTTPELSFAIKQLHATGGVNFSASHNMPDDNGIKIYDSFGSQPVAPHDQHLLDAMQSASDVTKMNFADGLAQGLIKAIPDQVHQDYLALYTDVFRGSPTPDAEQTIVYTPLCGCGVTTVTETLTHLGFSVASPPGEDKPDGSFESIPFRAPNPEVVQATHNACKFADEVGSGIVLSTDPDADRVGLEVKLPRGDWYHFDGNQIAAVLAYYLMLDPRGPKRKGLVIETLVTTKILSRIAAVAQDSCAVDDLLVGFKYVANVLKELEANGHYRGVKSTPSDLVLAAEESHGVIVGPWIMDKDATGACIYLASLYQQLKAENKTLLDYYKQLLGEVGGFDSAARSIVMSGAEGVAKRDSIMAALRESPLTEICGFAVNKWVDYWNESPESEGGFGPFLSDSDILPRNVLQLHTDRVVVTIRPSGTEPKLKLYCQLLPKGNDSAAGEANLAELRASTESLAEDMYNALLGSIGVELSDCALALPDIVDLHNKEGFDRDTLPALKTALAEGRYASLDDLLAWMREKTQSMTPGGDPLPALKGAIARFCAQNNSVVASAALGRELEDWSTR